MIAKKYMLVLAAALVAAAPAHAQRVSLADRVAALEAKANNPQQNLDLLNRITQQETELRELRVQLPKRSCPSWPLPPRLPSLAFRG